MHPWSWITEKTFDSSPLCDDDFQFLPQIQRFLLWVEGDVPSPRLLDRNLLGGSPEHGPVSRDDHPAKTCRDWYPHVIAHARSDRACRTLPSIASNAPRVTRVRDVRSYLGQNFAQADEIGIDVEANRSWLCQAASSSVVS